MDSVEEFVEENHCSVEETIEEIVEELAETAVPVDTAFADIVVALAVRTDIPPESRYYMPSVHLLPIRIYDFHTAITGIKERSVYQCNYVCAG